ncbi:MAG: hypothetical protein ACRC9F_01530 [Metamycoplasmataceae bacterium]
MKIVDNQLDLYCCINSIKLSEKLLFEIIFKKIGVNIIPFKAVTIIVVQNIENTNDKA